MDEGRRLWRVEVWGTDPDTHRYDVLEVVAVRAGTKIGAQRQAERDASARFPRVRLFNAAAQLAEEDV